MGYVAIRLIVDYLTFITPALMQPLINANVVIPAKAEIQTLNGSQFFDSSIDCDDLSVWILAFAGTTT